MKRKLFNTKNLVLSLKVIATSLVTSVIWIIPMLISRYLLMNLNMPFVSLLIALLSLVGYLYTFGFLANKLFNIRD